MAQGQLIGVELTYQPLHRLLEGFFQSLDNARYVSSVNICAVTLYNFFGIRLRIPLFQTSDSVISLLEPDGGVVWLKYEEPGSAMTLMCSSVMIFLWYLLSTPRTCIKV